MKFTYTCKKISLNDSVKAYAEKKVGKLEKFFKEEPEASVTFSVEKKNRCVVEITLRGASENVVTLAQLYNLPQDVLPR